MVRVGRCSYRLCCNLSVSRRGTLITPTGTTPTSRTFCSEQLRKLEGKVALITGGANGIGRAAAAKFVGQGAKVVIADIQEHNGRELADKLGSSAAFVRCDVSRESDVSDAVDFAVSKYGCLNVMYNNAGVPCRTASSFVDLDLGRFDQVMSINVRGVVAGIKHAARVMIPRGSGSILCTASVTGVLGGMAQHTYSISKSAVIGVVRSAASELCRHGIRINSISPFAVPTKFVMEELRLMYPGLDDSRLMKIIHDSGVLKGANCETDDIANAALYLASDDAKYVNGHNLVVDGGFTVMTNLEIPAPEDV